jgi:heme-degrading monooxygenase HmoA
MQWVTVATPPFGAIEQFDKVRGAQGEEPDGLQARYVGTADDGRLRIVTVWDSKEHAQRFFTEKLGPALAKALGPEPVGAPEMTGIDVARSYVRQPVG